MPVGAYDAIALLGPTASGKSAVSLAIAQTFEVEIVSVDSALVYRGMDIGTAKPTREERARVPHHLIDIRDPAEPYSAAEFATDARRLIAQIHARGRMPLLVGGTMLYYKALVDGLDDLPRADAQVRAGIETQARELGWPALHARLAQLDPITAARLAPHDAQRIQRALEICETSGQPMSALLGVRTPRQAVRTYTIALEPANRAWLHERIATRFDAMLQAGFADEVRTLRARHDLHVDLPAMRAVGYRQAWAWLNGEYGPQEDATANAQLRERAIAATRQLAKRQLTWLRSLPVHERINAEDDDVAAKCVQAIRQALPGCR
ncbi:MAG TPA: tRNA (adenosine(37)-N6)-dimethylallyltransferase MiaA [Burkholderiaceae bacterium]|nr:tRNA (adenosine(37)-N6)-dimethylallyltransferase MiaA [Burkholderiaceae bacterium]